MTNEFKNPHVGPSILIVVKGTENTASPKAQWIDVSQDEHYINADIEEFLTDAGEDDAPYIVQAYDGFEGAEPKLTESIEDFHAMADIIETDGKLGAMVLNNHHCHVASAQTTLANSRGKFVSEAEFAEQYVRSELDLPGFVLKNIKWDKMFADMATELNIFSITVESGEVHVFDNC